MRQQTSQIIASVLAIGLVITACGSTPSVAEAERAQWEAAEVSDYTLTYAVSGGAGNLGPKTVEVTDGIVTEIVKEPDGVSPADFTIERLFDELDAADIVLDVEFDPELGYPTYIALDPIEDAIDDEFSVTILSMETEGGG